MGKNLYQKMNCVMKDVETVFKGATISMGNGREYSAVNHDDVARLLHKPLAEHGIITKVSLSSAEVSCREKTNKFGNVIDEYRADVWVEVTFINADNPDEREVCRSFAYAFDSGDKAIGKAQSMAVKYVFLKNFVLESTDNEESRNHENELRSSKKETVTESPVSVTKKETTSKKTVGFTNKKSNTQTGSNESKPVEIDI